MASVAEAQAATHAALADAVQAKNLPPDAQKRAEKLLARLDTATRVTVLGMPRTGKTGVLNLLAGSQILQEGRSLGTAQLIYGEKEQALLTLRDGSSKTLKGPIDLAKIRDAEPVFTRLEMPLPALKKISLLELAMPDERAEQIKAVRWASKQTDIAIWCTSKYRTVEQTLWTGMPDTIKDHAILLLARADSLSVKRETALRELSRLAGDEFAHFLTVSAHEAQSASTADGGVNKTKLRASGGMALISTILRHIENGRQHTVDQAEILLQQHAKEIDKQTETDLLPDLENEPNLDEKPEAPETDQSAELETTGSDQDNWSTPAPEPAATDPEAEPEAAELIPQATAEPEEHVDDLARDVRPLDPVLQSTFQAAAERLKAVGVDLASLENVDTKTVIDRSAKTLAWLGDHLTDDSLPEHPFLLRFRTMAQDADDLVQLLRIEGDDDGAVDAVSAMLQLKRGFQAARMA